MTDNQLRQKIADTMGWTGGDGKDWYPEKTDKVMALIRQDKREMLERLRKQLKQDESGGWAVSKAVKVIDEHLTGLDEEDSDV